jgi:probable HAF family extracellular repeat protein
MSVSGEQNKRRRKMKLARRIAVRAAGLLLITCVLMASTGIAAARSVARQAPSTTYTFKTADYLGDTFTVLTAINDHGVIAGYHGDGTTTPSQGFILTLPLPGTFATENYPNAAQTQVNGINDNGDTSGTYIDQAGVSHGFLANANGFSTVGVPGATSNQIFGLNKFDQTTGDFQVAGGGYADVAYAPGFVLILPIIEATGINNQGLVIGFSTILGQTIYAVTVRGTTITQFYYPGTTYTKPLGVNNTGQIVGYYIDNAGSTHGFVDNNGTFTEIDVPGAVSTAVTGINNAGHIVGYYVDAAGNTNGFVGIPK